MKKVVILGPESTGKSTLAKKLAKHFEGCLVSEYAREYLSEIGNKYSIEDLLSIARGQVKKEIAIENKCDDEGKQIIFYDTDISVIKIWSEFKYNTCHPWIMQQFQERIYDLYLLTYPDLVWEPDPLRENPEDLRTIFDLYLKDMKNRNLNYEIIKGQGKARTQSAIDRVSHFLNPSD